MTDDPIRAIADAVLYEGYVLWPYRRSALKNAQRWTFGGIYPRAHAQAREAGDDPWTMQTQCLVEGDASTEVSLGVRFLHVVWRQLVDARGHDVDELHAGGELHLTWEEAVEREVTLDAVRLDELRAGRDVPIAIEAGATEEQLDAAGAVVRSWEPLRGCLRVRAEEVSAGLHRLTARIENVTPWEGGPREAAMRRTFCSTHTVLRAHGGSFVSLTDPPAALRDAAQACQNQGTWPVLVGETGERHTLLSSPIILEDHPRIAPESPGDLFDGGEIDQLLILNILNLTDEEKAEVRASDPRTREMLDRSEELSPEAAHALARAHGPRTADAPADAMARSSIRMTGGLNPGPGWDGLEGRAPRTVEVDGVHVGRGSLVRLRPGAGGDIFDLALTGKVAVVESVQQDMEGAISLAVVLEEDPGRDLGVARQPGHRFFFAAAEVEALGPSVDPLRVAPCSLPGSATCSWATTVSESRSRVGWPSASCPPV